MVQLDTGSSFTDEAIGHSSVPSEQAVPSLFFVQPSSHLLNRHSCKRWCFTFHFFSWCV